LWLEFEFETYDLVRLEIDLCATNISLALKFRSGNEYRVL
jgi:hypothetical protein